MNNQDVILRPIADQDTRAVAMLAQQLGYDGDPAAMAQRLLALRASSEHAVWVAEQAGRVQGWVHVFRAMRVESDPFAEIGGLVVEQQMRGTGLGRLLVQACADWARAQGLVRLRVRTNTQRLATHQFYQHLGFAALKSQQVFALIL